MSYIENIILQNFRVFNEKFTMEFKPITFLTGPNSSGKSSVLKSFLLMKSNTASSLQVLDFTGDKHNLGTFSNTRNKKADSESSISIGFTTKLTNGDVFGIPLYKEPITTRRSVYYLLREDIGEDQTTITIMLHYRRNDRSGKISKLELYTDNESKPFIVLSIAKDHSVNHELEINQSIIVKNKYLNNLFLNYRILKDGKRIKTPKSNLNILKKYTISSTSTLSDTPKDGIQDEPIHVFSVLYKMFLEDAFKNQINSNLTSHIYFYRHPLKQILQDFSYILENTEYLEAVRANTRRIYTNDSQGTSFNELILDYNSRDISTQSKKFIDKWLKQFDIADEIKFDHIEGVATSIYLMKDNEKIALADLGYGVTQFLPILLKIALEYPIKKIGNEDSIVKKLILLEEPETNLHPKLQSLLADFFVDIIKTFEVRLIIETHSEYLIRKMQILVGDNIIPQDFSTIYYFNDKDNDNINKVVKINFLKNGALDNEFGKGFYDEATNLKFELLKRKAL